MKVKKGRKVLFWIFATALTIIMGAGLGILLQPATAMAEDTITYPAEGQIIGVMVNSPLDIQCTTDSTSNVVWGIDFGSNPIPGSGIGISNDGKITGTPTSPGIYSIRVLLTYPDLTDYVLPQRDFTLQVYPAVAVAPADGSTIEVEVNTPLNIECSLSDDSISGAWYITLPQGLDGVSSSGRIISGTPTSIGEYAIRAMFFNTSSGPGAFRAYTSNFRLKVIPAGSGGGNTGANATSKTTTAAALALTPEQQAQMWAEYQALLAQMKAAEAASAHHHDYEWIETKPATEDENGEYVYKCNCGNVLYRVPTNAMGVFVKNTIEKIQKAGNGATVVINTKRWYSFPKSVFEALAARPDVSLTVNYLSEGYKGDPMTFTIPAGTDVSMLPDENGYAGFTFLGGIFGATPR